MPVMLWCATSSEGCGPDRATSAEQCKQFFAAGVQCPGNVTNGTSTYRVQYATVPFPLGCACNASDRSVYFRSLLYEGEEGNPCSLSYTCICQFLPALGDNCTQGTFFNITTNTTIRCMVNAVTPPPPSTTVATVKVLDDCTDTVTAQLTGQAFLWFLLGILMLAWKSRCTFAPTARQPPKGNATAESSAENGQHLQPMALSTPPYPTQHVVEMQPASAPHLHMYGVTGTRFGQLVVDVNGGAFGGMNHNALANNQMLVHVNSVTGTARLGPLDQTNDQDQELEEDASPGDRIFAVGMLIYDIFLLRGVFVVQGLIKDGTAPFSLYLYTIDFSLLSYYGYKGFYQKAPRYCPGCLYNNLHVVVKNKKLNKYFVSQKSLRFSATKKFIVGIGSIATIVNTVTAVSDIWCNWDEAEGNILS